MGNKIACDDLAAVAQYRADDDQSDSQHYPGNVRNGTTGFIRADTADYLVRDGGLGHSSVAPGQP